MTSVLHKHHVLQDWISPLNCAIFNTARRHPSFDASLLRSEDQRIAALVTSRVGWKQGEPRSLLVKTPSQLLALFDQSNCNSSALEIFEEIEVLFLFYTSICFLDLFLTFLFQILPHLSFRDLSDAVSRSSQVSELTVFFSQYMYNCPFYICDIVALLHCQV